MLPQEIQNLVRTSLTRSATLIVLCYFLFLPHFDAICDILLNKRTTTWNMFVLYDKEAKLFDGDVTYASVLR